MSFLTRVLVFQPIIIFCIYAIQFTKTIELAMNFKDDIMSIIAKREEFAFIVDFISNNDMEHIFKGILYTNLAFSILAILGLRVFGVLEALFVLGYGLIKYNPFTEAAQFQHIYGITYELILVLGIVFSILITSTSSCGSCKASVEEHEEITTPSKSDMSKTRSKSPHSKKKMY